MAKANENDKTEDTRFARGGMVGQGTEQVQGADEVEQPADGGGLRQRTEQELAERQSFRQAEDYAPPAGEGAKVNPDAQRNDPDGEAKPTA